MELQIKVQHLDEPVKNIPLILEAFREIGTWKVPLDFHHQADQNLIVAIFSPILLANQQVLNSQQTVDLMGEIMSHLCEVTVNLINYDMLYDVEFGNRKHRYFVLGRCAMFLHAYSDNEEDL